MRRSARRVGALRCAHAMSPADVFGVAAAGDFLRDVAIEARYELALFDGSYTLEGG